MNLRRMDEENIFNNSSSEDKKLFVLMVHPLDLLVMFFRNLLVRQNHGSQRMYHLDTS